jgi:Xaa-Pro aminopeptidase
MVSTSLGGIQMSEFLQRRARLQHVLRDNGVHGYLLTQNIDLFYFTGSMQNGYAFIPAYGDAIFYVKRSVSRAREEADCRVEALGPFRAFADQLFDDFTGLKEQDALRIATEFDVLPVQIYLRLQSLFQDVTFVDGSLWVREIRMLKSAYEVKCIRQAATFIDEAFHQSLQQLNIGMSEIEYMASIENHVREKGHLGVMRMRSYNQEVITGMVAAGEDAAVPTYFDGPAGGRGLHPAAPQGPSRRPIQANEPILVDIGCCIEGYVIDQTRTVCIGELHPELMRAYDWSEKILRETERMLVPGTICEDIYEQALKIAAEAELEAHFMGYGTDQVKFLGHGIGLEIDEFPVLAKGFKYPLQQGMVIAIEPKFTFPGVGVVGIEDTYLITESGFERLTVTDQHLFKVDKAKKEA